MNGAGGPIRPVPTIRDGADLLALLGVPFTDEQLAAITADPTPLVVVAGAGSGKTTVMAARVVWLIGTGVVAPAGVLGLTFTNKAATELARRVRSALQRAGLVDPGGWPGDARESMATGTEDGEPEIATYHRYAAALIAEHGLRVGVEPRARLLADAARYQLAARVIRSAPGPLTALTKSVSMLVPDLLALEAECSEHLIDLDELRAFDADLIARLSGEGPQAGRAAESSGSALGRALLAARRRSELTDLVDAYRTAKSELELLDFGDQMALAARLAETCPPVGAMERARHEVVLLDEYQDTSVAQRRMLVALFGGGHPVTAVGDPCQAIYGWRGASVANLADFPVHFAAPQVDGPAVLARRLTLRENRRNGENILGLANALASPLRMIHPGVEPLLAAAGARGQGEIRAALLPTWDDEINWVGGQVEAALSEGIEPKEVAVLVRATRDIGALHAELMRRQIPVEVVGLGGLIHLPEVADLIATLEVLDSPTANTALVRLLIGARWRIGPRDLALLGRRAAELAADPAAARGRDRLAAAIDGFDEERQPALADALTSPGELPYSAAALSRFATFDRELRGLRRHLGDPLIDLVHRVIADIGLEEEIAAGPQGLRARRRESLDAFADIAVGFTDLDGESSVSAFLAYLCAAAEHERGLDSAVPGSGDSVKLMTAHKAKGLEWDVVVLPDLTAGVFPSARGRSRWTTAGECLPFPLRGDRDSLPVVAQWTPAGLREFDNALRSHVALEERRLGYVATTRPRRRLVVGGHWWGPTQKRPRGPSEYLILARQLRESAGGPPAAAATAGDPGEPWAPEPAFGATNPLLDTGVEISWPTPLGADGLRARRAAATLVQRARRCESVGRPAPLLVGAEPTGADPTAGDRSRIADWDRDFGLLRSEFRARESASREVVLPATLSAAQLMALARDPDGLAADLARPLPRRPSAAARRGTRFHAWLADRWGQQALLEPDEIPGSGDADLCTDEELAILQAAFARSEFAERMPHRVEAPFSFAISGRIVRGRIDAIYRTPSGYEVIDWKTTTGGEADPLQLGLYRLAWADLAQVPPSAVGAAFHYVPSGVTTRPALPDRAELELLLTGGTDASGVAPTLPRPKPPPGVRGARRVGASVDGPRAREASVRS